MKKQSGLIRVGVESLKPALYTESTAPYTTDDPRLARSIIPRFCAIDKWGKESSAAFCINAVYGRGIITKGYLYAALFLLSYRLIVRGGKTRFLLTISSYLFCNFLPLTCLCKINNALHDF